MKLAKESPVHIVAILDRSGSMQNIIDDSIGGFNSFLAEQQKASGEARISVVLFDDKYDLLYDDLPVDKAAPLNNNTYKPRGMTALYDAIGRTLNRMFEKNPERAIVAILTDGEENASREFNHAQVKAMIEKAQAKGWEVVFLAANQDAFATGGALGISVNNISNFTLTGEGTRSAYATISATVLNYRGGNDGSN